MSVDEKTAVRVARAVREALLDWPHPGRTDPRTTAHDGIEFPLLMATIVEGAQADIAGAAQYLDVWRDNIHHYTRGQIFVSAASKPPTQDQNGNPVTSYYADFRLVGEVGGVTNVIASGAVNNATGPFYIPFGDSQSYTSLRLQARQIVNGVPDPTRTGDPSLSVQLSGRLWR